MAMTGPIRKSNKGRDGQIYVNNPKVVRLSEVYLIAAEAALKSRGYLRGRRIYEYVTQESY